MVHGYSFAKLFCQSEDGGRSVTLMLHLVCLHQVPRVKFWLKVTGLVGQKLVLILRFVYGKTLGTSSLKMY